MIRTLAIVSVLLATSACTSTTALTEPADHERLMQAHRRAFDAPVGQQVVWADITTGIGGAVRSIRESCESRSSDCGPESSRCRDFEEQTHSTDGTLERRSGRACLRTDGTLAIDFNIN